MIQKRKLLLILSVMFSGIMTANPVDKEDARKTAESFLNGRAVNKSRGAVKRESLQLVSSREAYYVFNVGQKEGFVIVSGDDRTPAILGYADNGCISTESMPDGLRYFLNGYEEQIAWLEENVTDEDNAATRGVQTTRSVARIPISPLIETHWDQDYPYNAYCPQINNEATVTGCVATSMAQVMYYHQWPEGDTPYISGYTTPTSLVVGGIAASSFDQAPSTNFGWEYMTHNYRKGFSRTSAEIAVAKLMRYCGQSIQMSYGLDSSEGYSEAIPDALKTYFGYDGGVRNTYRKNYSYQEWVELIYSELAERRPVLLGGQSIGGGHSFVCDGYDTDDYFHINWGWSGDSDGFYRLSVLQPWEQGIGGSSTLDGFSYSQNAVIGIQPSVSGTKDYCLSLEGLRFTSDGSSTSKMFTRSSATEAFTGISLYYLLYCYQYGSHTFDYALQLVDGSGKVKFTFYESQQTMSWNETISTSHSNLSIPSTVANGLYYIKVVSKPHDATDWQECFDGDRYQLTAVISDNSLTITVPIPKVTAPTDATITVKGNLIKGYEQEVIASITGGETDFHGNIILRVNNISVMGKMLDIPAGQTVDAHYSFIPTTAGNNTLSLYTAPQKGNLIGKETKVTIAESDATNNLDLSFSATVDNLTSDGKIYGNALRATITVTNPSSTNSYAGNLICYVLKWTTEDGVHWSGNSIGSTTYPIVVDKNSNTIINVTHDGLETGARYSAKLYYQHPNELVLGLNFGVNNNGLGTLIATTGYSVGDGSGNKTIYPPSNAIDATGASYVDLRDLGSLDEVSITPSSNPNCLYLLPDDNIPASLSNCNVVINGTATNLTLTDNDNFYSPIAFTADAASYTRTFNRAAAGTSGWDILFLPFTVKRVECEGLGRVDWFRSETDENKYFWLRAFTADGEGTVTFDYAQSIAANTPYIIAVPGKDFGEWQMTGKPVTFRGEHVSIAATAARNGTPATSGVSGNNFKFCGSTVNTSLSDVYMLNAKGSKFVKATTSTEVSAFRAWFSPISISSLSQASLSIVSPNTTAISILKDNVSTKGTDLWFSLDGRKLNGAPSARGIYIHNGKKIVIK